MILTKLILYLCFIIIIIIFQKDNKGKARYRSSSPWSYSWVNLEVMRFKQVNCLMLLLH